MSCGTPFSPIVRLRHWEELVWDISFLSVSSCGSSSWSEQNQEKKSSWNLLILSPAGIKSIKLLQILFFPLSTKGLRAFLGLRGFGGYVFTFQANCYFLPGNRKAEIGFHHICLNKSIFKQYNSLSLNSEIFSDSTRLIVNGFLYPFLCYL